MLRQSVVGAACVGLLAVLSQHPATTMAAAEPGAAANADTQDPSSARPRAAKREETKGELRARRLLEQFFGVKRDAPLPATGYSLETLVATVPDPLASRLDWLFDQQLDALRRAHEAAGHVAISYWLPWHDKAGDAATEPGVYLFRDGRRLRLLWLVGELPTSGVHRVAWQQALLQREDAHVALGVSAPSQLRVVGPVFSGSSWSLRAELDRWLDGDPARSAAVVTGGATDAENEHKLASPRISFQATVHCDETLFACLTGAVLKRLGIQTHEVAVLREASTRYGASAELQTAPQNPSGPLVLPFPMNISSLRESYAKTWIRDDKAKQGDTVALDLAERDVVGEVPKALSPLSTAASEQLLAELARTLEDHRIRLVVLFATDVRDKLFLGREIANRLPDLQLLTTESNLLYLRTELAEAQRGMLVLSTYQLFDTPTDWRPQSLRLPEQRMSFASDGAQGVYNAALVQLDLQGAALDYSFPIEAQKPKPETAQPTRPPVWLTCVGKTRMLPIAVYETRLASERPFGLDDDAAAKYAWIKSDKYPAALQEVEPPAREHELVEEPGLGTLLFTAVLGLAALVAGWRVVFPYGGPPDALTDLSVDPGKQSIAKQFAELARVSSVQHDALYGTVRALVLTSLLLPHSALLMQLALRARTATNIVHFALAAFATLAGACGSVVGLWRTLATAGRHHHRAWCFLVANGVAHGARWAVEILLRGCILLLALGWGTVMVLHAAWLLRLDATSREMYFHRVTRVEQCVTPFLPLLLIGAAMAAWCCWHLKRARLLAQSLPYEVPPDTERFDAEDDEPASLRPCLMLAIPDRRGHVVGAVLLLLAVWLHSQRQRSLECLVTAGTSWFDWLFFPGLLLMLMTTGWAAYRLAVTWRRFVRCLGTGNARLRAACKTIVGDHGVTTSLGLWRDAPQPDLQPASGASWRQLSAATPQAAARAPRHAADWQHLATLARAALDGDAADTANRRTLVAALRAQLPAIEAIDDAASDAGSEPGTARTRWLAAAHGALAVELIAWVRWTMSHLRTLALFLLLSLVLSAALLWAYPFHPQTLVRFSFLLVCGAVVGVLTWVVTGLSRNPVLAQLAQSDAAPGAWDRTFLRNVLTYSLLPLLTLVASQVPILGSTLFAWVEPLLKSALAAG
jgi:hypothetical protein